MKSSKWRVFSDDNAASFWTSVRFSLLRASASSGALCLLLFFSTTAIGQKMHLDVSDKGADEVALLLEALRGGDEVAALAVHERSIDASIRVWSAMILERQRFDLAKSSEDAEICEKSAVDTRPDDALDCGLFRVANLSLGGRRDEAKHLLVNLTSRFEGLGESARLRLARQRVISELASPSPLRAPEVDFDLDLKAGEKGLSVDGLVNGVPIAFVADTGAVGVVMSRSEADQRHVKVTGDKTAMDGWITRDLRAKQGVIDTLKLGPVVWHDVPVTIVDSDINLIGISLLSSLPAVQFTSRSLRVYHKGSRSIPRCVETMTMSSEVDGANLKMVVPLSINGRYERVLLDTGSSQYLLGSKATLSRVKPLHRWRGSVGDIGGAHESVNIPDAKALLLVDGQPIDVHFSVLSDSDTPWLFTLGAAALNDMDFLLDFQNHHSCLLLHRTLHP